MTNRLEFKLPDVGEGIAEAEIVAWHVQVGDTIEEDAALADVMTDKATVEISSPVAGRVIEIAGAVGDQIAIGSTLVVFEVDDEGRADTAHFIPDTQAAPVPPAPAEEQHTPLALEVDAWHSSVRREEEGGTGSASSPVNPGTELPLPSASAQGAHVTASPTVRQRAKELGIDLRQIAPGAPGRIRHQDLDSYLLYHAGSGYRPASATRPDEQVKVIGLRRRIAENMAASKRHIPHFSYVEEIDVTKLEALRADLNDTRGDKSKLTVLPLLITAICRALPDYPMINARYDDEAGIVTRSGAVHLGIATQTPAGLMVPVIRNAESRNVWQLAREINRLAEAARSGKATSEELSGSTLTVTSLGTLGGIATTPVINRPEVAIIGPNRIVERPIVSDGAITIAKLMNLSMSCDHRVVDGWDAASFVQRLKSLLETPALLFVDP